VDALINALVDDRSDKVRSAAAVALAELRAERATRAFIKAYDRYSEGREEILRAMRHFRTHEAIEFLIQCLNEEDRKLSRAAHESLIMLTGEKFENSQDVWLGWWSNAKKTPRYIRVGDESPNIMPPEKERPKEGSSGKPETGGAETPQPAGAGKREASEGGAPTDKKTAE
jgi:hypothetical protein